MSNDGRIAIIVAADEPALFFTSIKAAEGYLEAVDVEAGVYSAAYGPGGQPYRISAAEGRVVITPDLGRGSDSEALKALLLRYLTAAGMPASEADSLQTLMKACERDVSA